jgi:hypothetical protein
MEEEEAPAPRAPPTATEITDSLVDLLHAVCNVHQGTIGFGRKCRRETLASIVGWLDAHYSCVPTSAEMALLLACRGRPRPTPPQASRPSCSAVARRCNYSSSSPSNCSSTRALCAATTPRTHRSNARFVRVTWRKSALVAVQLAMRATSASVAAQMLRSSRMSAKGTPVGWLN